MNKDDFVREVTACLDQRYCQNLGYVLYSSALTLKPGLAYFMGANPGGEGESGHTIRADLDYWLHRVAGKDCSYLDWSWNDAKYEPGQHPIQRNLQLIAKALGLNIRDVAGSNLVFRATQRQSEVDFNKEAEVCWPVHEVILRIVDPKVVVVFGNGAVSPYEFLHNMAREDCEVLNGHRPSWCSLRQCKAFRGKLCGKQRIVLGLPHLSRFNVQRDNNGDVLDWVKRTSF